jgi:hypothetical protein
MGTPHPTKGAPILVCDDEPQILRALQVIINDAGFVAGPSFAIRAAYPARSR